MGLTVLDSSIVMAFRDASDPHHGAAVSALKDAATQVLVVPVIAYAEVLVGAYRKGRKHASLAERFFEEAVRVEPASRSIARTAAKLRAARGMRLPDALIVATAIDLDADEVLTADDRWRGMDRRVRVVHGGH
ncbi:MAG: PIN domain-containing protein [Actinomycetota bacterium]|nr:PIN domain-containing protein [Actinomycetota bacterium]